MASLYRGLVFLTIIENWYNLERIYSSFQSNMIYRKGLVTKPLHKTEIRTLSNLTMKIDIKLFPRTWLCQLTVLFRISLIR